MNDILKKLGGNSDAVLWGVAFAGVCVLVGLGKIKPETLEYLLFALLGRSGTKQPSTGHSPEGTK